MWNLIYLGTWDAPKIVTKERVLWQRLANEDRLALGLIGSKLDGLRQGAEGNETDSTDRHTFEACGTTLKRISGHKIKRGGLTWSLSVAIILVYFC